MAQALRYRLFRSPRMPAAFADAAGAPGVLAAVPGVAIRAIARSVRMPGVRSGRGLRPLAGAVVLTPERLLLAIGSAPVLDLDLRAPEPDTAHRLHFAADGAHLVIDVASVTDPGAGTVELFVRTELDAAALAQLPVKPRAFDVGKTIPTMLRGWV